MTDEMEKSNDVNQPGSLREQLLYARYLLKDKCGKVIETIKQLFHRVARYVASAETKYSKDIDCVDTFTKVFEDMMSQKRFLPNSPTLMNAGRENGLLSACFVLPIPDSIDGIFNAVKHTALIQKAGGGTGFDFSSLRPTGDYVASSGGKTSGPISFWRVLAETTHAIQQGVHRRGANMGMMHLSHPDIIKFIHAKQNIAAFTNFNISVKVTDAFMKQLQDNPDALHVVVNPRTGKRYIIPHSVDIHSYAIDELIPEDQATSDCYTVQEIWKMIITNAHATGEPGICFIDRVNQNNPTPNLGQIEATNPCGEQPLLAFEACNLGSIDISQFIRQDACDLDWDTLAETVKHAVRFLDNVIDVNHYPIPQIEEITLGNRKVGLGVMGFADTLILLRIRYDTEEAVTFAKKLSSFIQTHAHQASEEFAKERGCFPNWQGSIWDTKYHRPMRNVAITTIAPTGTISIIADCNGGIEPLFDITTKRRALDGQEFIQLNPVIERIGTQQGWLTDEVRKQLAQGIPPKNIPEIPKTIAAVLVTAHEITPEWHVRIQAAFQENVDNAVSKTVNLSSDATVDDVDKIFHLAYKFGCKGTTVYRDGCRKNQVLTSAHTLPGAGIVSISPRPRQRKTDGQTIKFRMGCGTLFVAVNQDDNGLCEVFANLGKAGGCPAQSEATCRVVSAALRCGVKPEVMIEQLRNIRCLSTIARRKDNKDIDVLSCPDAIARAMSESLGENCESIAISLVNKCPDCHYPLRREEGCNVCDNCGYSKCG